MTKKQGLYIITHGCQMNRYDSERMAAGLSERFELTDDPELAELVIINTCSVREKPERKVFSEIGGFEQAKKRNPKLRIVVAGCVAQQLKDAIVLKAPIVDLVIGPDEEKDLPRLLDQLDKERPEIACDFDAGAFRLTPFILPQRPDKTAPLSAFLAIQKGCNHYCTYCIVPHVRGREKSRPLAEIVSEAEGFARQGVKEITLLGQNINDYGLDFGGRPDLADCLEAMEKIEGLRRIRFVTSHPAGVTKRHIDAVAELPKVCEYLHLPIQAGSDEVLKRMKRGYSVKEYLDIIERFREKMPDIAVSGDMIVGFPGETKEDFQATLSLVDEVRYDTLFSFIYSPRPFTPAAKMADDVALEEKHERLQMLIERQRPISLAKNQAEEGTTQRVLVEGTAKKNRETEVMGRTRKNKIVNFAGEQALIGRIVEVEITTGMQNSLKGVLAEKKLKKGKGAEKNHAD